MLVRRFVLKVINNENQFNPSWNHHWSHYRTNCVGNHSSVQRIKIVDSSELAAAKFLIYLFIQIHLLLHWRYMDLKKGILFKKNKKSFFPVIYTAMQIFIAMDYLILMLILENEKSMWQGIFFPPRKSNWIHVHRI